MDTKRILTLAGALLVAALAVFLIRQGLRHLVLPQPVVAAALASEAEDEETAPEVEPRWQDFAVPDALLPEGDAALARPLLRAGLEAASPFAQRRRAAPNLRLEGMARGAQPYALVSGRVLKVGDEIRRYRLERIDRDGVMLVGPSARRLRLTLPSAGD